MLKNYFLVSLRNLKRHFSYSFVNIFGLTVGLACTLVIGIWVFQEYSYDRHFKDANQIYRIGVNFFNIGDMAIGPEILKEKLTNYPQVENVSGLSPMGKAEFVIGNQETIIDQAFSADKEFFNLFSYDFEFGDPESALANPQSIVITEEVALQLFGRKDVLHQTVEIKDEDQPYAITGIVTDGAKSHIPAKVWFSQNVPPQQLSWTSASSYMYVKIADKNPDVKLDEILYEQLEEIRQMFAADQSMEEFKEGGLYKFLPIPLTAIHLQSQLKFEPSPAGDESTVKVFAGIAILILVLASINFINIATARSTTRAREVGIRKLLGTNRLGLLFLFTLESIIICLISVTFAIGVGELFLYGFESISGLELLPTLFGSAKQFIYIYLGALVLGIVAGIYPALYITQYQPVKVLKGQIYFNEKGNVRNGLVLFQFTISICLLIVSMFIFHQLKFIEDKDMGFDMDNVLVINNINQIPEHSAYLKEELQKKSYVHQVSLNERLPASSTTSSVTALYNQEKKEVWAQRFLGDEDMLDCLGFRLLKGRNFSETLASDTAAVILNEAAVSELGLTNPIDQTLNNGDLKVIGVISNFNYESLRNKVGPAMLQMKTGHNNNLSVKFSGTHITQLVDGLNETWATFGVEEAPNYYFLDENFARLVEKERVLSKAVLAFTILAMFISCLGLYGLSIFIAERKTKEIGIRRVLGASISSVTVLFSKNYAKLILIAFIVSIPISYLITQEWLATYAYKIDIGVSPFLLSGMIALMLGLVTISWQSIRTATKNPAITLRNE